ncbi:hypothetical protein [Sphaerimonospora thailandensis]|uniref:Uncharacterized protein n=1 Tax=Sphaerimonospora thailandensis TaxID=795644 RepID=A0A8J3VYC9_9ACTN|nr:hypothetical protein [Sphaerimonospora thailandensis]GIH68806.1 hypothetical protein Mth01_10590 [Sphaerimonospora thailandensis]
MLGRRIEASVRVADHVAVIDMGRVVLPARAGGVDDLHVIRDAYFGRAGQ